MVVSKLEEKEEGCVNSACNGAEVNQQGFAYRTVREKGSTGFRGCVAESMVEHHFESRAQGRLGNNGDQRHHESSTC